MTTHLYIPSRAEAEAWMSSETSRVGVSEGHALRVISREYFRGREAIDVLGELMAGYLGGPFGPVPSAALRARAWAVLAAGPTSEDDVKGTKR